MEIFSFHADIEDKNVAKKIRSIIKYLQIQVPCQVFMAREGENVSHIIVEKDKQYSSHKNVSAIRLFQSIIEDKMIFDGYESLEDTIAKDFKDLRRQDPSLTCGRKLKVTFNFLGVRK